MRRITGKLPSVMQDTTIVNHRHVRLLREFAGIIPTGRLEDHVVGLPDTWLLAGLE